MRYIGAHRKRRSLREWWDDLYAAMKRFLTVEEAKDDPIKYRPWHL